MVVVSEAVTVTFTVFRPADRATWCPAVLRSASVPLNTTAALALLAVALMVAWVTVDATPTS